MVDLAASVDGGRSWTARRPDWCGGNECLGALIRSLDGGTVYWAGDEARLPFQPEQVQLTRTRDGGASWRPIRLAGLADLDPNLGSLALDPIVTADRLVVIGRATTARCTPGSARPTPTSWSGPG